MSVSVGELIQNKYRIVRLIGQGGMGAVYEGLNEGIARRVAIKVLHGELASQHGIVERFEREAKAAGKIGNDHILEVLDLGAFEDGDRFMVMEYLDGETLEERLHRLGRLSPHEIYPLVRQLLVGLSAAHDAGIIHRDLKPDNVFVLREKAGQPDFVKIIDFGISKFTTLGSDMRMTATGAVMGTPYFMAPEQAKGSRDADVRSDLYAVGVILFRALTGSVPFDAGSFNELLFKIVLADTPRASSIVAELDPAFDDLIFRAMARDPADRFQSAMQMVRALDEWGSGASSGRSSTGSERTRRSYGVAGRVDSTAWARGGLATEFADSGASAAGSGPSAGAGLHTESGQALPVVPVNSRGRLWLLVGGSIGLLLLVVLGLSVLRGTPDSPTAVAVTSAAPVVRAAVSVRPIASASPDVAPPVAALPVAVAAESERLAASAQPSPPQVDVNPQPDNLRPKAGVTVAGAGKKRAERPVHAAVAAPVDVPPPVAVTPSPPAAAPRNPPRGKSWDYDY